MNAASYLQSGVVLISILTLVWQLLVLFACCSGIGLYLRFLVPKQFSLLNKFLFCLIGGLFLVVLVAQNLVYLGVTVRVSAWLLLGAALAQVWLCRYHLIAWARTLYASAEIRMLAVVIFLTVIFHGVVPIRQGLESYYGKGYEDQLNYVMLAEFLKEQPYSTSARDIGLHPWLVRAVDFQSDPEESGISHGPGLKMTGLKNERIGQSIITAEISVWSGTDGKGGYAATVIFFLTALAVCLYAFLREIGMSRFMAGSGALLGACLPAVTRLSLDGFLSQVSILFVFPFFASLLRPRELSARSFTLFFSLTLTYLLAAYSEIAPIGLCTFFLGVMFVRQDGFRTKRLMLMSAVLLIVLLNPYYLRNLIGFLGQQYYMAANGSFLEHMAPNMFALRGFSELIFGTIRSSPAALFFDFCTILLSVLSLAGVFVLSRRDQLVFGAILLPVILVILYLATRIPPSIYAIAKITLSTLPFVIGLVFVTLSKIAASNQHRPMGVLTDLLSVLIVAAAAAGSVCYYSEVLNNDGFLRYVREPLFLNVCRELEQIKGKRVLIFETYPSLAMWLCYHARHNDVYFSGGFMDSPVSLPSPFSPVPDLAKVEFVATRDRLVELRAPKVYCLTLVDDTPGEDRTNGHDRYWLGPPAALHFLALRPISANLKMRFGPGPEATAYPIEYLLADRQGHISRGEIRGENVEAMPINIRPGLTTLQLSVQAPAGNPNTETPFPILAELDGIEVSDIDLNPGR